jgi:hypothetical protein
MRRWAVLAILTYREYVPVAALRPPCLAVARYAFLLDHPSVEAIA